MAPSSGGIRGRPRYGLPENPCTADGGAGVGIGDVVEGGVLVVVGSVASSQSLASPSSWQKLDLLVFSLTTVTNRRGEGAGGGGGGGGGGCG